MAWSSGSPAIQVYDSSISSSVPQNLPLTSTSTILLSSGPRRHRLRIYVNDVGFFESAMKAIIGGSYSAPSGAIVGVSPVVVDVGSSDAAFQTCVPASLPTRTLTYAVLTDLGAEPWEAASGEIVEARLAGCVGLH